MQYCFLRRVAHLPALSLPALTKLRVSSILVSEKPRFLRRREGKAGIKITVDGGRIHRWHVSGQRHLNQRVVANAFTVAEQYKEL